MPTGRRPEVKTKPCSEIGQAGAQHTDDGASRSQPAPERIAKSRPPRRERTMDWRDVESNMRRRLVRPPPPEESKPPDLHRLSRKEIIRRRAMPAVLLPPEYVGPSLPGERKKLPEIRRKDLTQSSESAKEALRNFRKARSKKAPLETIRENKSAEHVLDPGFWDFFDKHCKL